MNSNVLTHLNNMLDIVVSQKPINYAHMKENINVKRGGWDDETIKAVDKRLSEFEEVNPKFRRGK
ncbi:MAG: hypothetical protein COA78_22160 [Blastopirellula sp.]|nr:MAG: hypothetical protein COA78_22160 [Blastopirellula sp.]